MRRGGGRGGLIETKDLCEVGENGRLFNLPKLKYNVEKLKHKKLEVMQPMIKTESELSDGK